MAEVLSRDDGARRRIGAYVVGVLALLWVLVGVTIVTVVAWEAVTMDDQSCPVPGLDSVYGDSSWQAWPPGQV
ncbi:MAG: hypothetical protein ABW035_08995, partial [Acidimicrobiales bacterium]